MSHLYLPAEHTDTDLALASAVAEAIESNELFVAWTCEGGTAAAPEVRALLRDPVEPARHGPFTVALIEIAAAVRALMSALFFRGATQPAQASPPARASRSELEEAA